MKMKYAITALAVLLGSTTLSHAMDTAPLPLSKPIKTVAVAVEVQAEALHPAIGPIEIAEILPPIQTVPIIEDDTPNISKSVRYNVAASRVFPRSVASYPPAVPVELAATQYGLNTHQGDSGGPIYTTSPATTLEQPNYTVSHSQQQKTAPIISLQNDKTQLHELFLTPNVTTTINYQGSERITTVVMGKAEDFFVDTPKSRQTISIRPKTSRSKSNMTVVTNRDIYHFNLAASSNEATATYGVVIKESEEKEEGSGTSLADLEDLNFSYTFRASEELRPLRLFDDGKHTFFQFPDHIATPAIFAVNAEGKESIVNHHTRGKYTVVESLGRQFTLRRGNVFTCIYNKAFPKARHGAEAPQREGAV